jgi:mannitol 2-dehydrogenase
MSAMASSTCCKETESNGASPVIKVNADNIPLVQRRGETAKDHVLVPSYDRSRIKTGIVHVGIGGFHRSHQAYYTHQLMEQGGGPDWGICGIALLTYDRKIYDTLVAQNGLYTLLVTDSVGNSTATIIGSITEYLYAPDDSIAVTEKMAHDDTKIITLTITEGGYKMDSSTGEFQLHDTAVQHDIHNPLNPTTIFGYVTQSLKRRMERGLPGITIQSCDNIQHNGDVTRKMFASYIQAAEPVILDWVLANVCFPNAMVDRITPVTSPSDIEQLRSQYHIEDAWPVVCEPFCQWVIEDNFAQGRPAWDLVGAQFVDHVDAYEKMKIRMLNGGHSTIAFAGILHTYTYIYETMADPLFCGFLSDFMELEAAPILDPVPGIDLTVYRKTLLGRFANPNIKDTLARIVSETSAKAPKFLVATITDHLSRSEDVNKIKRCTLVLAAWCRYLEQCKADGTNVQDAMSAALLDQVSTGDDASFLTLTSIFGQLHENIAFVTQFKKLLQALRSDGIVHVLTALSSF